MVRVWIVESEEQTFFLVMGFESPLEVGECFVHFVDQSLGLAEWDESYRLACFVTPRGVAG